MLDGDEIIQKTIQDEQIEIRKKYSRGIEKELLYVDVNPNSGGS